MGTVSLLYLAVAKREHRVIAKCSVDNGDLITWALNAQSVKDCLNLCLIESASLETVRYILEPNVFNLVKLVYRCELIPDCDLGN